jgi:hypothetical protein
MNGENTMVRANLKGVFPTYKILKDGSRKCYWYYRATGTRLHGEPGSPEFISDFAAAERHMRDRLAHGGTLNGLIREYTLSEEFQKTLAPSTQGEYRRMLTKAETEFGDMPIAALGCLGLRMTESEYDFDKESLVAEKN